MANLTKNFDQYFETIQTNTSKIGELKDAEGKVTEINEYKSQKSGNRSLKMTINVNGGDIFTYLGFSSEKSMEITKARLTKLCIAAVGMAETKKIYEAVANDEDVTDDKDFILEFASKLNKKLRKNPTDVIVSRTKNEEKGLWDTKWHLKDSDEPALPEESKAKPEDADDFLGEIAEEAKN